MVTATNSCIACSHTLCSSYVNYFINKLSEEIIIIINYKGIQPFGDTKSIVCSCMALV